MQPEEALVRAFITPKKRGRYLEKLGSPDSRAKFIAQHFFHMIDLDERYATRLDPRVPQLEMRSSPTAHVEGIYELLRLRGAPRRCFVVSADPDIDGHEADLMATLRRVVGARTGTFISCIPGRLAYFEGEDDNERYILQRPRGSGPIDRQTSG